MNVDKAALRYLAALLEARTGQQIGPSRLWRVETVLKPLVREKGLDSLEALVAAMRTGRDTALTERAVEALLNNETFFFRDAPAFDLLQNGAFEALRAARATTRRLSIWCAACSTGQEAYSLAILFADAAQRWDGWTVDITATDVSAAAVERAKTGIYTQFEIQRGLPIRAMLRWFEQEGEDWHVKRELARRIRFKTHNLLDPQPSRFDLVLCRNVLLYFTPEKRREAFDRLAEATAPDGFLMLGAGETALGQTDAFTPAADLRGLYRPVAASRRQAA